MTNTNINWFVYGSLVISYYNSMKYIVVIYSVFINYYTSTVKDIQQ